MAQKDNSKAYLIIIAILLLIIGIGIGYYVGINNKPLEEPKKEERKEEPEEEEKQEEEKEEKSIPSGKLKSDGVKDSVEITLNGKTNTLLLENNKREKGIMKYGDTNLDFMIKYGASDGVIRDTVNEIEYWVFLGKDNKEYLVVAYGNGLQQLLLIINDETNIIKKYNTHYEHTKFYNDENDDCYVYVDEGNEQFKTLYSIGYKLVSFYKYKEGSAKKEENGEISVILNKIDIVIDEDVVSEKETGQSLSGNAGQCT